MTETAIDFYDRITEGTSYSRTATVQHKSGSSLELDMHPAEKKVLLDQVNKLPEDIFQTFEGVDDREEAEELAKDELGGFAGVDGGTVEAFEVLCYESLSHDDLTDAQIGEIVEEFDIEALFGIGAEVMEFSFEEAGAIKDFQT